MEAIHPLKGMTAFNFMDLVSLEGSTAREHGAKAYSIDLWSAALRKVGSVLQSAVPGRFRGEGGVVLMDKGM